MVKTSSSKENVANLAWYPCERQLELKKNGTRNLKYKVQKHFNISPTSNRLANISSTLTCIEMKMIYYDILKLLPVTAKHIEISTALACFEQLFPIPL